MSLSLVCSNAHALGDQWYIGIGGSGTFLQPNPEDNTLDITESQGVGGNVFFGVDLDDRSSAQLTFYSLGEAEIDNSETLPYQAVDGSILYRIYDSKDGRISRSAVSLALYGRFALGFINRDTDIELENDAAVYFGAGGGAELFLTRNLSLRAEALYHDRDAASASFQLVARFGGRGAGPVPRVPRPEPPAPPVTASPLPNVPAVPQAPAVAPAPQAPPSPPVAVVPAPSNFADADGDTVADNLDQCPGSTAGFPVRATGCALLDGVLSGIKFTPGTSQLIPGATNQLDFLANVLTRYPQARVELHAHADDRGTVRDQAILTRARLREIGTYLVQRGVRSNRLVLRSFGGTRPLYNNGTPQGRENNNRIEVLEKTN